MCLKSTRFFSIYPDGLVELDGHAFEVNGRQLVVHKERHQLYVVGGDYKNYLISSVFGFGVPIRPTRNRLVAVAYANEEVPKISERDWAERCRVAEQVRKALKVVEG